VIFITIVIQTTEVRKVLGKLLERLKEDYPEARIVGHRDLQGVQKDCLCFEV
jgi:hypothetical protein